MISGVSDVVKPVEKRIIGDRMASSFCLDFFELGELGRLSGEICPREVMFKKIYSSRQEDLIIHRGKRTSNDVLYGGKWTFERNSNRLAGNFKMMLDIESPF